MLATAAWHATHPFQAGLQQMGLPGTAVLGQDAVEIAPLLRHPFAHGISKKGERSGGHGINPWEKSGREHDMKSQLMQRCLRNNLSFRYD
jgi:hypothetical protein